MPSPKQYADALDSSSWADRALSMKGRATFLPFQDTLPGSVMNKRSLALPGIVAGAINAFTAPGRAYRGSDPTFNSQEEALDFALNTIGGAMMHRPKTTVPNTRSNYETKQDGPFYRVTPRSYGEAQGNAGRNIDTNGQSSNRTANAGRDREAARGVQELQQVGALDRRVVPPPETNKPFQIARQYTKATQGTDFVFPDMPVSSFEKQSAIARVHQLALEGSPEYKAATFDAYQRQMPELVEMTGAKNHDEFMEKA